MPKITITDRSGTLHMLEGKSGYSLMELAVQNDIEGIDADCRGSCACATCHVHVSEAWMAAVGPPNELEAEMLDLANDVGPLSRLSCQIRLVDELDGLEVRVP